MVPAIKGYHKLGFIIIGINPDVRVSTGSADRFFTEFRTFFSILGDIELGDFGLTYVSTMCCGMRR